MFRSAHRQPDSIDPREAERRLSQGELVLVDVREPQEWRAGHAAHARHIPLATLPRQIGALAGEGIPIAFICQSGRRSAAACGAASEHGVTAINVRGGMAAWKRASLPTADG